MVDTEHAYISMLLRGTHVVDQEKAITLSREKRGGKLTIRKPLPSAFRSRSAQSHTEIIPMLLAVMT